MADLLLGVSRPKGSGKAIRLIIIKYMLHSILRVVILVAVALFILQFVPEFVRTHVEEIMMALEIHRLFLSRG